MQCLWALENCLPVVSEQRLDPNLSAPKDCSWAPGQRLLLQSSICMPREVLLCSRTTPVVLACVFACGFQTTGGGLSSNACAPPNTACRFPNKMRGIGAPVRSRPAAVASRTAPVGSTPYFGCLSSSCVFAFGFQDSSARISNRIAFKTTS